MERRQARRADTRRGHWMASARVWPGRDVAVLNVSPGGALIEGETRLIPGRRIELHLASPEGRLLVAARVLRAYVSCLAPDGGIRYRGALAFEAPLAMAVPEETCVG